MKLKEECQSGAKNKGEPLGPPLIPLRALTAALGSVPTGAPILRVRLLKHNIPNQTTERPFDACDGVDSPPLGRANPCGSCASSTRPLDLGPSWPGVLNDWSGHEFAGQSNRYNRCRAKVARARTCFYGPRASTKGRVEARSQADKIDRTDLAQKIVTRQRVETRKRQPDDGTRRATRWQMQAVRFDGPRRTSATTQEKQTRPSDKIRRDRP